MFQTMNECTLKNLEVVFEVVGFVSTLRLEWIEQVQIQHQHRLHCVALVFLLLLYCCSQVDLVKDFNFVPLPPLVQSCIPINLHLVLLSAISHKI